MKRVLVTYSNEKYSNAKKRLINSAKKINYFSDLYSFSPSDIDSNYYNKYKNILNIERGNGLWLWKPYFINKILSELDYGDILFYCDSGALFIHSPSILESEFSDIFVSDIPLIEKQFTKKKVFEEFKCNDEVKETNQIIATYVIIKKTKKSEKIISEWLSKCENKDLLCPPENIENEDSYFISHREDQSILSIICKKNKIKPFADITQRVYLPYTYWNKDFIFKKTNSKRCKVILYLHKLSTPTPYLIIKQALRQVVYNYANLIHLKLKKR